jgi:hypothetical protein
MFALACVGAQCFRLGAVARRAAARDVAMAQVLLVQPIEEDVP